MTSALEFLQRFQQDPEFLTRASACASDDARRAFLRKEGFDFTVEELEAAIRSLSAYKDGKQIQETKESRNSKRFDVFLKVTEIDGKAVDDTVMIDISAWGARVESLIPHSTDTTLELRFAMPGEKDDVRLGGKVVWSGQVPLSKSHNIGLKFYKSLDQMSREGKFSLEKFRSAVQKRHEDIASKEFFTIKEFAEKLGVHWFTVWRWTMENRIKFKQVKAGCKILIPASELFQFQVPNE